MNRFLIALPLVVLFSLHSEAQKKELTLRDAVLKAGSDLAPERLRALQWIKGSQTYSYVKADQLMMGTIGKSIDLAIASLPELNKHLPDSVHLKSWPMISWIDPDHFRFEHAGKLWVFQLKGTVSAATRLDPESENVELTDGSNDVAYTVGDNLYFMPAGNGKNKHVAITSDGGEGIVNGKSVHRQEYGIEKGIFWSPKGNRLAFYRMNESMVTTYDLEDIGTMPSTFEPIRYPMAGQASHHVTVGVYDRNSSTTTFLKTGEPLDQYLTNISWEPDEKHLLVAHLDRATQNMRMVRYDATTGEALATVFTEHDEKYVEPLQPARFMRTRPSQFIWRSNRDGWHHLYLYDSGKGLIRQLTKGTWEVKEIIGVDPKESFAVIEGTAPIDTAKPSGAMETQLYRVDLRTGKTTRLTAESGTHHGQLSSDGSYLIDAWSSISVANRIVVRDAATGSVLKTLVDSTDPLAAYRSGSIEIVTVSGEQGDALNARLIKPSFFDPTKKYPVLIYVYNGPHVQLVTNSFLGGASPWMLQAAERGYVIWTLDGHGSQWRGKAFEQVIHRQLGITEVKDQMHGVEWLKSQPWVDPARIGVHGWSYGGHMTTAMLTRHPEAFAVGVAGGPVMDWRMYEVMYGERYMDTPQENPEGYAATNLPAMASKLQDPLLVITGGKDDTVVPEHSYSFLKACIGAGVQVDFFNYPGHGHNVRGKDRLHLMEKVLGYIDAQLHPARP